MQNALGGGEEGEKAEKDEVLGIGRQETDSGGASQGPEEVDRNGILKDEHLPK